MADGLGLHGLGEKMNSVDEGIRRDNGEMRARRLPNRRVVADPNLGLPCAGSARVRRFGDLPDRSNERVFGQRTPAGSGSPIARRARNSAAGSAALKMLDPITTTSTPAATTSAMFLRPIPPSISSWQAGL
jgi:hypothetical protein